MKQTILCLKSGPLLFYDNFGKIGPNSIFFHC